MRRGRAAGWAWAPACTRPHQPCCNSILITSAQDYFSIVAFFIFLRETLEASVIIAVLLQVMNRTMPRLKRQGELSVFIASVCGM